MNNKITGLILAAGYSSRMGTNKALLPFGNETVIERQIKCFIETGIHDLFIVVGYDADKVTNAVNRYPVNIIYNKNYSDGMFSSIQSGVKVIDPDVFDGVFLLPVDHPLIHSHALETIIERFGKLSVKILYPCYHNRKGHPPLFSTCLIKEILESRGDAGLKGIFTKYQNYAEFVDMGNQECLMDIDTEQDYLKALDYLNSHIVPDMEECEYIYRQCKVSDEIRAHSNKVADIARILAEALKKKGYNLDPGIVFFAGLLHDIQKGSPGHAGKAAELLMKMGYKQLAVLIQNHMDIEAFYASKICNESVLYFSDKIVNRDRIESIEERMTKINHNSQFLQQAQNRLKTARLIQKKIEAALAESVVQVLLKQGQING